LLKLKLVVVRLRVETAMSALGGLLEAGGRMTHRAQARRATMRSRAIP
jgi:hypothetical protein